jgi:hypothetical protein
MPNPPDSPPVSDGERFHPSEEICGLTWDHDLRVTGHSDGITVYVCDKCGAEIFEDDE